MILGPFYHYNHLVYFTVTLSDPVYHNIHMVSFVNKTIGPFYHYIHMVSFVNKTIGPFYHYIHMVLFTMTPCIFLLLCSPISLLMIYFNEEDLTQDLEIVPFQMNEILDDPDDSH